MRNKYFFFFIIFFSIFFIGCGDSPKYFKPLKIYNLKSVKSTTKVINSNSRVALLNNGKVLSKKFSTTVPSIKLKNGESIIDLSINKAVILDINNKVKILDLKKNLYSSFTLSGVLISGKIIEDKYLAYILENNYFGIYDIKNKKVLYTNNSERSLIIDSKIEAPLNIDNLVFFPLLDGKLIIFNLDNMQIIKEIYVSVEKNLNNIIFLDRVDNGIIAATSNKVILVTGAGIQEYKAKISKVIIDKDNNIFVSQKNGDITKFNKFLIIKKNINIPFANFSEAIIYKDKIYLLEKMGYLIELDKNLKTYKTYKVSIPENETFTTKDKIYYDNKIISLSNIHI